MVLLYKGKETESLNDLRLKSFHTKVIDNKSATHRSNIPPASASAIFHCFRVYHQVQNWMGRSLSPEEWSWKIGGSNIIPIHSDQDPAPQFLLKLVRYKGKAA